MTVAGLRAKHATGVPGQGTYEDLLRRGACAVPAPDAAEAARHAELGPARGPVDRAHEPRRVHEGLQQHQRMMKPCRPVPHQMARAQPQHPGPEIGHRAGAGTGCCWPPDAAGRTCGAASSQSTRHAPGTSAPPPKTTPAPPTRRATARHTTASRPPSAPPQGNDASPNRASSSGNTAPSVTCESSIPSPLRCSPCARDLYRLKQEVQRIRLEIQEPQSRPVSVRP